MKKLFYFITFFILFAFNVNNANACSCAPVPSPKVAREQAAVVFSGRVLDIALPETGAIKSTADLITIKFAVLKLWKGPVNETTIIKTTRDSVSCGFAFEKGQDYLVYAYQAGNDFMTNICQRTKLLTLAQDDLIELGGAIDISNISPANNQLPPSPMKLFNTYFSLILIIIFLLILFYLLTKTKPREKPKQQKTNNQTKID